MENIIADTGFIVALVNNSDQYHETVKRVYLQYKKIIMPQTVLAEVAYLIRREKGTKSVAFFIKNLSKSNFIPMSLTLEDIERIGEILEEYADSRIDFVDASVMAMAERLKTSIILTLDHRDFRLFRPKHCTAFELRP